MKNRFLQKAIDSSSNDSKIFVKKSLDLADRIELLLISQGKTQKDLALMLGKTESEISKWLTGQHNFTIKTISKLESVLGEELVNIPTRMYLESEVEYFEFEPTIIDFDPFPVKSRYVIS